MFWLDHETADLLDAGCVAQSLGDFLRAKSGDHSGLSAQEVALIRDGSRWTRDTDGHAYLQRRGRLREWPPFLWARHAWIVAELAFGSAEEQLERSEVLAFDFETEAALLAQSEPLALYWLLRSLLLDEPATLAEVLRRTEAHPSPLVGAVARFVRETPTPRDESLFGKARIRARAYRERLRVPQGFDASAF